jgi:DNA-binding GntR family transcriptional regulator
MAVTADGAAPDVAQRLAGADLGVLDQDNAPERVAELAERMYLSLAQATGNELRLEVSRLFLARTHFVRVIDLRNRATAAAKVEAVVGVGRSLLAGDLETARALTREALIGRLSRLDHLVGLANAEASTTPFLVGADHVNL